MTDLRQLAKDRPCLVRIPECCNGRPDTTVLAHYRMSGISGAGLKSPDLLGAWACFECHSAVDRRAYMELNREYVQLCHLQGVMRTLAELVKMGKVHW